MIDVDYTAKNQIGTLTVSTDELLIATSLRLAFLRIQQIVEAGGTPMLEVTELHGLNTIKP